MNVRNCSVLPQMSILLLQLGDLHGGLEAETITGTRNQGRSPAARNRCTRVPRTGSNQGQTKLTEVTPRRPRHAHQTHNTRLHLTIVNVIQERSARTTTASLPGDARLGARALPESLGRAKNGWCRYRLNATNNGRNTTTLKVKDPRTHRVRAWRQPGMGRGGRGM
jgi:hypothetical protein